MEGYQNSFDINDTFRDPNLNLMSQYEQGYAYYKYLYMQMEYKIKCKEYEKLCNEKVNSNTHSGLSQGRSA